MINDVFSRLAKDPRSLTSSSAEPLQSADSNDTPSLNLQPASIDVANESNETRNGTHYEISVSHDDADKPLPFNESSRTELGNSFQSEETAAAVLSSSTELPAAPSKARLTASEEGLSEGIQTIASSRNETVQVDYSDCFLIFKALCNLSIKDAPDT